MSLYPGDLAIFFNGDHTRVVELVHYHDEYYGRENIWAVKSVGTPISYKGQTLDVFGVPKGTLKSLQF